MDRKAIGVVYFRPEVDAGRVRLVFAEVVHRCERRDAEFRDLLAEEKAGAHFHDRFRRRLDDEPIRATDAARIEQRIDGELRRARIGPFDPEFGERGEFFTGAQRRVDGKSTRGDAVNRPVA